MARRRTAAAKPVPAKTVTVRFKQVTQRAMLIASTSLLGLAASGVLGLSAAAAQDASQTLAGTKILPGGRWTGARLPTVAQTNNGLVMTIKQEQKAALMDWSQFDVGASEEVHFEQGGADWVALNRIFNANPTQIAGKITAKGQVWLANTNGVVFKGTAQVNTQSILVTTAVVPDSVLDTGGLLDTRPRTDGGAWGDLPGLLDLAKGDIVIEQGARLTLKSSDPAVASAATFLGVNVINRGTIDVTDGQVVILTGEEFLLRPSGVSEFTFYDFLRGLYGLSSTHNRYDRFSNEARWTAEKYARAAEVGGMKMVNEGVINATRGTILIQGAAIEQRGTVTATTGVRQRTGAMLLRAGFGFDDATTNYTGIFDYLGGDIVFGKNSLTQVAPEAGTDSSPALETFTGINRSRIAVVGRNVLMDENATLRAKSGLITIDGNYSAMMNGDFPGADRGKAGSFVMKQGALIDVSGVKGIQRDVGDNVVDLEIRANELAPSPAQRDGILYGQDVKVDTRRGASIVDWTGTLANQNLTAEDRSINGGEVQIRALSTVQVEKGAKIDLSGGSADYAGGWIDVTQLTALDGRVVDIADADASSKYVGLSKTRRYEAGYTEGGDAGRLEILSSSQKLLGRVVSETTIGQRQAAAGVKGQKPATPAGSIEPAVTTRLPKGGTVVLGTGSESLAEYFFDQVFINPDGGPVTMTVNGGQVTLDPSKLGLDGKLSDGGYTQAQYNVGTDLRYSLLAPGWVLYQNQPVELRQALMTQGYTGAALDALLLPDATLPAGFVRGSKPSFSFIEDDFISGAQNLTILNKSDAKPYNFSILDNTQIRLAAGGALTLGATPANIGRNVLLSAAAGKITVLASHIGAGTKISAAGAWTNDLDGTGVWGGYVDGGSISIGNGVVQTLIPAGVILDGDVTLDASGGGWWKRTGPAIQANRGSFELVNGKGGSIAAQRDQSQAAQTFIDRLDFRLGGLGGSGSLSLAGLGDIVIGAGEGSAAGDTLYLSDARLNGWGLTGLAIDGGYKTFAIGDELIGRISTGPIINPNTTNEAAPDYYIVRAGERITAAHIATIRAVNQTAATYNASLPPTGTPRTLLTAIAVGANIQVAAGTRIDLVGQTLKLNGSPSLIASGADLADHTTSTVLADYLRPTGVNFTLNATGSLSVADNAVVKVDTNGSIGLSGLFVDIGGDLIARSGAISLSTPVPQAGPYALPGRMNLRSTALLDARGIAVTHEVQGAAPGDRWIEGAIHSGGVITLSANEMIVESGAIMDVSGASGMLTVSAPTRFGVTRVNRMVGSDGGTIKISASEGYMLGDVIGDAGTPSARAGILDMTGGAPGQMFVPGSTSGQYGLQTIINALSTRLLRTSSNGLNATANKPFTNLRTWWAGTAQASLRTATGLQAADIEPIPFTRSGPNSTVTAADLAPILALFEASFAPMSSTDPTGKFYLDPTLTALPSGITGDSPLPGGAILPKFSMPASYTPQVSERAFLNTMAALRQSTTSSTSPTAQVLAAVSTPTSFTLGKTALDRMATFDTVTLGSITPVGDVTISAKSQLNLPSVISASSANLTLAAPQIRFGGVAGQALNASRPNTPATGGVLTAKANDIYVNAVDFYGFSKVNLEATHSLAGGDLASFNSRIFAAGDLTLKAGQIYPYTGKQFSLLSDKSITIQSTGAGGAAPLSAGGVLKLKAPTINQGGVLAAPFGTIDFSGTTVNFLPGSLTTVSAAGRTILYGQTIDGSNWYGPTPGNAQDLLLTTPPEKRIVVSGDNVDVQAGAIIDASGGGDVLGLEFVQGPKGGTNILAGDGVFAISAAFGADVALGQAPSDKPREQLAVGDIVWLPAFDGNPAGYYTLLPAQYALTPGAYRINVASQGPSSSTARTIGDGSFILTGHQAAEQGVAYNDQTFTTFQVMAGAGVRERSEFIETSGNNFFSSERFLTGLERSGSVYNADPRLPTDGGFMTIAARQSLQLNGRFSAAGATSKDRGGVLDIAGDLIVIAGADTDISDLGAGYLRLDPKQLSGVAESLLIGGVRRQGAAGLEIVTGYESRANTGAPVGGTIGAERIVVRNSEANALTGPEILFTSTGEILFESGSVVRAAGDGAQAENVIIRPELAQHTNTTVNPQVTYPAEDRGAFVRVSNLGDVSITRTNAKTDRGDVTLESGARLEATDAVAVNATRNTTLEPGAILKAGVVEAAAGLVSFGNAPAVQAGLVLNDAAFAALAGAQTLRLRSFSTFDVHGGVNLATANNLVLDGGGFVNVDGHSSSAFSAKNLTISNTDAPGYTPSAGGGALSLNADTITFGEGAVGLGFSDVDIGAKGRVIFSGVGKLVAPGDVSITTTQVTASSGASHGVKAGGALQLLGQAAPATLDAFQTAGATLDMQGQSVRVDLPVNIASGVFRATATSGDVVVGSKARIDASGSAITFYEVTEYLGAGGIGLTSEAGNVTVENGAVLDLSGGATGDAGDLIVSAGQGVAALDGLLKAQAGAGAKGGSFTLRTATLSDFGALNSKLNDSGFSRSRRFAVVNGNVDLTGETRVDEFELSTGAGSITIDGAAKIITTRDKGGRIVIASGGDLVVEDGALLDASAKGAGDQRGGLVSLQVGDAGSLDVGAAILRVGGHGAGQAGEVQLRARQIGNDVAINRYTALVQGGNTTLEAYKVTDLGAGDHVIDTALQNQVIAQAAAFMATGNVSAIRTRLGQADANAFVITPGVEIRSGGNLTLKDSWNLASARFGGQPGTLTLRAGGDLSLDANLSDGFLSAQPAPTPASNPASVTSPLTNDASWSYNLVAGADFAQTNVLATKVSATGEGDVLINAVVRTGTGDIKVASSGDVAYKSRTYKFEAVQDGADAYIVSIIQPDGTLKTYSATRPAGSNDNYTVVADDLGLITIAGSGIGSVRVENGDRFFSENFDNDSSKVAFNIQYVDGALYTAGREAAPLANFDTPTVFYYRDSSTGLIATGYRPASFLEKGGDVSIVAGGDILGAGDAIKEITWFRQRGQVGQIDLAGPMDALFTTDLGGVYQQTAAWITPDSFRQGVGALGGGDVTIRAGGNVDNLAVVLPTTTRVSGGKTAGDTKVLEVRGGGDLDMQVGGDLLGGSYWVSKGTATIDVDGRMDKTSNPGIENPRSFAQTTIRFGPDRRLQGATVLILDDATMRIVTGGDARFNGVRSSTNIPGTLYDDGSWLSYTENTALEVVSSGGDVQYHAGLSRQYELIDILPSKTRLVSISGSVLIGDANENPYNIVTDSFPTGHLEILARKDIGFWNLYTSGQSQTLHGYDAPGFGMGWGDAVDAARALNPYRNVRFSTSWGAGGPGYGRLEGTRNPFEGNSTYARIYAKDGDIYAAQGTMTNRFYPGAPQAYNMGNMIFGYETRIKAGDDIRLPSMEFLNQDVDDVATVQAGGSIYMPNIQVYGEGRLWVQAGDEIYMGNSPGRGIRAVEEMPLAGFNKEHGADVSVLAGIDQAPEYDAFFAYYLGGGDLGSRPVYLSEYYTFDTIGLGTPHPSVLADGQTEVTVYAVDLVNYWNEMHGRPPISLEDDKGKPVARGTLVSKISKADYDAASTWLANLDPAKKQGLATRIMFAEMKTAGREAVGASKATDPSSIRGGDPLRGYAAVGKLFPGAQRKPGEAKQAGEARWFGDLVMTDSQIRTDGGGDIEILVPGGLVQLASLSVANTNPNASGVLSQDGGAVKALTYGDYIVNQSRTMTADDGDILIWSSFGNIDAGKGRKTSLSIPPITFPVDKNGITQIVRSGLPNGAGIATLNRVDGTPGGDVDLYAFNGIVNAGDAGIRASRDLFVGALEIRGLDNITVGGVTNVELNTEDAQLGPINLENFAQSAEDDAIDKAFDMSAEVEKLRTVSQTILTGSVVSFGEDPDEEKKRK
ncbi:filamentous haemagglutinin family protein [Caulobacter sp.]|uniref:filamentous haemagglutinin family protein n=1 Tax=Caulobacter sp. TaxID=78 RepID=UPI003BAE2184